MYLDDIIVHSRSFEQHLLNLKRVFQRLREANLKLNPRRCTLFQTEVTYLGYMVSEKGISADPVKVAAVKDWPQPRNVNELRSFIGLCSYYRRFVPGFSLLAKPLHSLTEKNAKFEWNEPCEQAFQKLKEILTRTPVLAYPNFDKPYILDKFILVTLMLSPEDLVNRNIANIAKNEKFKKPQCTMKNQVMKEPLVVGVARKGLLINLP